MSEIAGSSGVHQKEEEKPEKSTEVVNQGEDDDDEQAVTMLDVLAEENDLEEDANAVLGGSDDKNCTYANGYVPRQALYACMTCIPLEVKDFKPAGVCLACSYNCHEGHDLIELYTKRNFKCDCGNSKFGEKKCSLQPDKDAENVNNTYNQNFKGVYCVCQRPYPDPDDKEEDDMVQCITCEDWYHGRHLELPGALKVTSHNFSEMVCGACMEKFSFLWNYAKEYAVSDESADVSIDEAQQKPEKPEASKKEEPDTSLQSEKQETEKTEDHSDAALLPSTEKSASDIMKSADGTGKCFLADKEDAVAKKEAVLWSTGWRKKLCSCDECKALYKKHGLDFLPDESDMVQFYEEEGKQRHAESGSQYEQGLKALSSLDRVRQLDAIQEYNQMQVELKEFLSDFAAKKRIVREEDIKGFFEELKARKKRRLEGGVQHMCH